MSNRENEWREEFEIYWFSMPHKDTSKLVKGSKGYLASKSSGIYAYDEALYIVACRARQSEIDSLKAELEKAQDKICDLSDRLEQSVDINVLIHMDDSIEELLHCIRLRKSVCSPSDHIAQEERETKILKKYGKLKYD